MIATTGVVAMSLATLGMAGASAAPEQQSMWISYEIGLDGRGELIWWLRVAVSGRLRCNQARSPHPPEPALPNGGSIEALQLPIKSARVLGEGAIKLIVVAAGQRLAVGTTTLPLTRSS